MNEPLITTNFWWMLCYYYNTITTVDLDMGILLSVHWTICKYINYFFTRSLNMKRTLWNEVSFIMFLDMSSIFKQFWPAKQHHPKHSLTWHYITIRIMLQIMVPYQHANLNEQSSHPLITGYSMHAFGDEIMKIFRD